LQLFKDIFYLFFPKVCLNCKLQLKRNESLICTICRHDFPKTNFSNTPENVLEKKFYGRVPIESGTSLFFYHKNGKIQQIIHQLKYKNQEEIGTLFGNWLGGEMQEGGRFGNIDYIIPVPLHPNKKKKRGYNQLTKFGEILAKKLNANLIENKLMKVGSTETQTKKSLIERWRNIDELFELSDILFFENKHILLIDDVITTGATIETCANQLLKTKNIKISIAVMAYTE
jgi:ComF family protein